MTVGALLGALTILPLTAAEPKNFGDLTLEQLMNESITSVTKKEQRLSDAAAAIAVVTNDDLRRSGATTLPDALRMVPGVEVAAVNAGQWAVTSRGFNSVFANKLLVLIDGRAVYTPLFSGVDWILQQVMMEDVDKIEVIRGPGAALWGANAMNGVINVATREAKDTQGSLVYFGGGDVHQTLGGVRHGGRIGESTYFRVFGGYQKHQANVLADGSPASDEWQTTFGGFRLDREIRGTASFSWRAGVTTTDFDSGVSEAMNLHTLARFTRRWTPETSLEFQAYLDREHEDDLRSRRTIDTRDVTAQQNFPVGDRHSIVWGFGYRGSDTRVRQTNPEVQVHHGYFDYNVANIFAQDQITLLPDRLTVTGGVKLEHNNLTGWETQPSLSAVFKASAEQTIWASASRAVRTPSQLDYEDLFSIAIGPPVRGPDGNIYLPRLVGNNQLRSEVLVAYQAGYRRQINARTSVDVAAFYNVYERVTEANGAPRLIPGTPFGTAEFSWRNLGNGNSYGVEVLVNAALTETWRLTASYSGLAMQDLPQTDSGLEEGSPKHQVKLRSSYDFAKRASVDAQFRFIDKLMLTRGYVAADVRFSYRPDDATEISLIGQNLLNDHQAETNASPLTQFTESKRGFYAKISRRF